MSDRIIYKEQTWLLLMITFRFTQKYLRQNPSQHSLKKKTNSIKFFRDRLCE